MPGGVVQPKDFRTSDPDNQIEPTVFRKEQGGKGRLIETLRFDPHRPSLQPPTAQVMQHHHWLRRGPAGAATNADREIDRVVVGFVALHQRHGLLSDEFSVL